MNTYMAMKDRHQQEVNDFPMFFAFNDEQFKEGMVKLGLKPSETNKLYKLGGTGGFYRKEDAPKLHEMFNRHETEMKEAIVKDDTFVYDMFYYELGNHEYSYTHDVTDTIDALGLTIDEVRSDERLYNALQKACKAQTESD